MTLTEEQLKELGQKYHDGEDFQPEAEAAMNAYIIDKIQGHYNDYYQLIVVEKLADMLFEDWIGLKKSLWQVQYGFVRESEMINEELTIEDKVELNKAGDKLLEASSTGVYTEGEENGEQTNP